MNDLLSQDIMYLPGVGPNRKKVLSSELGIETFGDLLEYYPYKHVDRTKIYKVHDLTGDMPFVQVVGHILSYETFEMGPGRERVVAHFTDGTGLMDLVWFNGGKYAKKNYLTGKEYLIFGRPSVFNNRLQVQHPDVEPSPADSPEKNEETSGPGFRPFYNTTDKMKKLNMTSRTVERLVKTLLDKLKEPLPETIPDFILGPRHLMGRDEALRAIHFPQSARQLEAARVRLKFEELFFVQLNILRYASDQRHKYRGYVFRRIGPVFNDFYQKNLPFELTAAQKRVMHEIRADVCSGRQMNRLLQGDVGSGKTLVALMAMLIALDNGYQACMMAPTEILAEQHLATLKDFLSDMPVRVELLTGMVKGKKRQEVLDGLLSGKVEILVGTHAVIEDTVQFRQLGLVVVDEQHRFGVAQRAKLWGKGLRVESLELSDASSANNGKVSQLSTLNAQPSIPHVLVMTATPIPRTLAMTLYGDLDVSVIDELPPGRKPIRTTHVFETRMTSLYDGIRRQIREGRQVYIVFPLIEESEKIDLKNLEQGFEVLREAFPEFRLSKVHGKMKPHDKEEEMQRFVSGETQILVATTVIEVGVNVPNASVMVILDAQRFGLSQLHQLRGRVGRGADQSYCIFVSDNNSKVAMERLEILKTSNDGFEIASKDLSIRGPGEFMGVRQSGVLSFKNFDLYRDAQIAQKAMEAVNQLLSGMIPLTDSEQQKLEKASAVLKGGILL